MQPEQIDIVQLHPLETGFDGLHHTLALVVRAVHAAIA
jgi:hypothetical protein